MIATTTIRVIRFSRENDEGGGLVPYQVIQGPSPVYADINEEDYVAANGLFGGFFKDKFKGTILDKNERARRRALREKTDAQSSKINAQAAKQLGVTDPTTAMLAASLNNPVNAPAQPTAKTGMSTMQMGGIAAGIIVLIIVAVVISKKKEGGK